MPPPVCPVPHAGPKTLGPSAADGPPDHPTPEAPAEPSAALDLSAGPTPEAWTYAPGGSSPEAPSRSEGDRSSLPGGSPPWSTVGQPLFVNGHIMIVHVYLDTVNFGITRNLEKFCVRVQDAIVTEIRSTKNDHLCHYFPIVPSLTIAYVDSQRTQRYTRHRRMTTVSSDSGQVAQVVALVQQPVKAPTAPATADSAPVPAGLAGAAQIQSCGSGCAACPSQLRR